MCSMKDSGVEWIGEIPENSIICRLKYLLTEEMMYGANESGRQSPKNAVRYIRITDITPDGLLRDKNRLYLDYEIAEKYMLSDKDILFARSGASVGKSFIYRSEYGDCAFAGYLIKAKCNPKILLPDFLFYYSQCGLYEIWKSMIFIQSTIQNISAEKYGNLPVVLPEVHEQSRIVFAIKDRVRNIDMLIRNNETQIERLKQYKQSLITETVTRGLDPDAPMKDSGVEWIGMIPAGWTVFPSKYMFAERNERRIDSDEQLTASQKYGMISQSEYMEREHSRIVMADKGLENWKHIEPNDFVISLRSFQGGLEMSSISGCVTWHYVVLRASRNLCSPYYKWLFKSSAYITALQMTCNYIRDGQDLRYSNFVKVPLCEPPHSEQIAIAAYLDSRTSQIDTVISIKQRKIEKLKQYRQSLIYECVTGKLDLR